MGHDERPDPGGGGTTPSDSENLIVHHELFAGEQPDPDDAPGVDVAEIVADLEGEAATDIPALYDTIDHLVEHLFSTPPPLEAQCRLEFTYGSYRIALTQDGHATFMKVSD